MFRQSGGGRRRERARKCATHTHFSIPARVATRGDTCQQVYMTHTYLQWVPTRSLERPGWEGALHNTHGETRTLGNGGETHRREQGNTPKLEGCILLLCTPTDEAPCLPPAAASVRVAASGKDERQSPPSDEDSTARRSSVINIATIMPHIHRFLFTKIAPRKWPISCPMMQLPAACGGKAGVPMGGRWGNPSSTRPTPPPLYSVPIVMYGGCGWKEKGRAGACGGGVSIASPTRNPIPRSSALHSRGTSPSHFIAFYAHLFSILCCSIAGTTRVKHFFFASSIPVCEPCEVGKYS